MKLAPILAQYLHSQKKLELAGIGKFLLDTTARINADAQHTTEGISFQYDPTTPENDALTSYISSETKKMKSLAAADLSSYTELARQFLNIGKPFQIEGIGTLIKNQGGELQFTADYILIDKVKETGIKELSATSISDEFITSYETLRPRGESTPGFKKAFLGFLAAATMVFIVWVGYRTYKQHSPSISNVENESVPVSDTTKYVSPMAEPAGSVTSSPPETKKAKGEYKFVVEVASKKRAFFRYNTLKKGNVPIQLTTSDSVNYKLFFTLAATPADTARISDSLTVWYPAVNHKHTYAEK